MNRKVFVMAVLVLVLCFGCKSQSQPPSEVSVYDIKLVVWDTREPHLPGAFPYSELLANTVESFTEEHGIEVAIEHKSRQEIEDLLLGNYQGDPPCVVYSAEWPFVSESMQDLTEIVCSDDYLEAALSYWTHNGKLMGVPSYVHWLCLAKKISDSADSQDRMGYLLTAPGFLHSVLDYQHDGWAFENICNYIDWVKDTYAPCCNDVLDMWEQNEINMLCPVTPHLFKWLKLTQEGSGPQMLPIPNPQGEPRFHFTVPGYVVLAKNHEQAKYAVMLASALAANRGRWAARAIGGVPAAHQDVPVFHLESGFSREERTALLAGFKNSGAYVVDRIEFNSRNNIRTTITPAIGKYLSGKTNRREFEESIRFGMKGHTNQ